MADPQEAATLDEELADDFRLMGVEIDPDDVTSDEETVFKVWVKSWQSFQVFLGCQTQWRPAATLGGISWTGIDYAGADVVMRRYKADDSIFADLQHMEAEALKAFREVPAEC